MYYCTNSDKIELITDDFNKTIYNMVIADDRNIPLENAVLLDGQLYDNRELDYWKLIKTRELEQYLINADNNGYETSFKLKADSNLQSVENLNLGLTLYQMNSEMKADSKVVFCDYYNQLHEITLVDYKLICKEVGNYYSNNYSKKWTVRKAINEAKTIEELKAIVI